MFSSDKWFGASPSFYNGVATQSARFNSSSSANLSKTPDASDRKVWTWSAWVKRSSLGASRAIWSVTSSAHFAIFFNSDNSLRVWTNGGNGSIYTNALFRDTNAWYHIALTSKNSGNYFELYINGVKETSFSYDNRSNYPGSSDTEVNSNAVHYLGAWNNGGLQYFDGYLADVNFLDGITVGDTGGILDQFIEIKNGVCIPKAYSGSYGTNGYRLEFTGFLGTDTSGNSNNYTPSGFDSDDTNIPDSPENNFATLNSISGYTVTLSEGNLKYTTANPNPATSTISIPTSGKWYWEVYVSSVGDAIIGVQNRPNVQSNGYSGRKTGYYKDGGSGGGSGSIYIEGTGYGGSQASYTNGDVISVLYNSDDMKISWYKNGSQEGLTFDVTDTDVTPIVWQASGSGSTSGTFNFGQDSTFAGTISAGGNTDANGIGDFKYTVPSGYLALCSANLPEPTIGANSDTQSSDHFNTVLWSGNSSTQAITGLGFQPDWVWGKTRSGTYGHALYDTSRGISNVLSSENNNAEASYGSFSSFDSDGFTLGSNALLNESGKTYVAWNWKANGGTTSSNSDGTITSTVQANTTAGFSILTTTGNGSSGATIGHGLNAIPKWIIAKQRNDANYFTIYHHTMGTGSEMYLALTQAKTNSNFWITDPTSSVFSVSNSDYVNENNSTYVFYCFAEIEGYSKFGSYTGNGSSDGAFVFTGFRPAWIMLKRTDSADDWIMVDTTRATINDAGQTLFANLSDAETDYSTQMDIVSNGFKLRNNGGSKNASSGSYIYMAFAEQPFKFANAR